VNGDPYYALEQGPIPTRGLDAIHAKNKHPEDDAAVAQHGRLRGWTFEWNGRPPDLKALSKSDTKYTISQIRLRILWWGRRCRLPAAEHLAGGAVVAARQ
jgi:hypothetical protein